MVDEDCAGAGDWEGEFDSDIVVVKRALGVER